MIMISQNFPSLNYRDLREQIHVDTNIECSCTYDMVTYKNFGYIEDAQDRIRIPEYNDEYDYRKTYEFLRAQYFVDMVSRNMLYLWHHHDAKSELRNYLEQEVLDTSASIYVMEFNIHPNHSILFKIRMNRHELYVNEIVELLGLFPDEFEYNKDRHSICLNIDVDRMRENDRKLRKISYE